jgi:hypothetical protein
MKLPIASFSSGYESKTVVNCGFFKYISLIENYKIWRVGAGCGPVGIHCECSNPANLTDTTKFS